MKRYLVIFAIVAFYALACNNGKTDNSTVGKDTIAAFTPPAIIAADSAGSTELSVSSFEMKDDSVFTDGSIPTTWENAGFTDVKGFKLFLKQLQLWVMDNNKEKLASAVRYPLKNIKTPEELVEKYDAVFTKDVKLSFATINFNQVFRNAQGAMTNGGRVWFAQDGKGFKIIAINY